MHLDVGGRLKRLLLASPLLFAIHELEEYWTAIPWLRQHQSDLPAFLRGHVPQSNSFIVFAGIVFFAAFAASAWMFVRRPQDRPWPELFAVLLLARGENALGHIAQAAWLGGYTPGVITAVAIVLPISIVTLRDVFSRGGLSTRSLVWMVPAALMVQVVALALLAWPSFR